MDGQMTSDPRDIEPTVSDPWPFLRTLTTARIGLGRVGVSLPTHQQLDFQLAHARARDAVYSELDLPRMQRELAERDHESILLRSAAGIRRTYLERPDLGRRLDAASARELSERERGLPGTYDAAFVIADGLSALAVERHAIPLLDALWSLLNPQEWRLAPVALVEHGRVAISDEIGAALGTDQVVILIGERPGLSAPDSLGIYLTWGPKPGNVDADRNCISNIRAEGLSYAEAAHKLAYLMHEARKRRLSGVMLKDETTALQQVTDDDRRMARNFLVDGN